MWLYLPKFRFEAAHWGALGVVMGHHKKTRQRWA